MRGPDERINYTQKKLCTLQYSVRSGCVSKLLILRRQTVLWPFLEPSIEQRKTVVTPFWTQDGMRGLEKLGVSDPPCILAQGQIWVSDPPFCCYETLSAVLKKSKCGVSDLPSSVFHVIYENFVQQDIHGLLSDRVWHIFLHFSVPWLIVLETI